MHLFKHVLTPNLNIAYFEWIPKEVEPLSSIVLVHGWPDCAEGWIDVATRLCQEGYHVIVPSLRGFGSTQFRTKDTPRSGQLVALGRDLLDLLNGLSIIKPVLVGHDWGARAAANACGLQPGVANQLVLLSVGYGTNNPNQTLPLYQARNYWYQWYMATPRGKAAIENDRASFTRMMWDLWAPIGWYQESDFLTALRAFDNPDWTEIVIHSYRHRWGLDRSDPRYDQDELLLNPAPILAVPTLVIHGAADTCNDPRTSENKEAFFSQGYERMLLPNVGHFPHRESPEVVAQGIIDFIK